MVIKCHYNCRYQIRLCKQSEQPDKKGSCQGRNQEASFITDRAPELFGCPDINNHFNISQVWPLLESGQRQANSERGHNFNITPGVSQKQKPAEFSSLACKPLTQTKFSLTPRTDGGNSVVKVTIESKKVKVPCISCFIQEYVISKLVCKLHFTFF